MRKLSALLAAAGLLVAGCEVVGDRRLEPAGPGVDAALIEQGREEFHDYGCVACHIIPGVRNANGLVGPPLTRFGQRVFIAGQVLNTPENLVAWILDPEAIEPGTAMPDLEVTVEDARAMAAYLHSLD